MTKTIKQRRLLVFLLSIFLTFNLLGLARVQAATTTGKDVVNYAEKYLGSYYIWGASGPTTFDCSGFTMYVYKHFGIALSHYTGDQVTAGTAVSKANLKAGDLVFFYSDHSHVGIYIGNGEFIHCGGGDRTCTTIEIAKKRDAKVKISSLSSGYYSDNYYSARRVLN